MAVAQDVRHAGLVPMERRVPSAPMDAQGRHLWQLTVGRRPRGGGEGVVGARGPAKSPLPGVRRLGRIPGVHAPAKDLAKLQGLTMKRHRRAAELWLCLGRCPKLARAVQALFTQATLPVMPRVRAAGMVWFREPHTCRKPQVP